jgi:hypothetical protein
LRLFIPAYVAFGSLVILTSFKPFQITLSYSLPPLLGRYVELSKTSICNFSRENGPWVNLDISYQAEGLVATWCFVVRDKGTIKLRLCSRFSSHTAAHASLQRSPVLSIIIVLPYNHIISIQKAKNFLKNASEQQTKVLAQLNESRSTRKICSSQLDDGGYKDSRGPRRKETDKSNAKVRCLFKAIYLMHLGEFKCASFHNAPSVSGRQGEKRRVEE